MTSDEAIVLSDLLWRWETDGTLDSLPYAHRAEWVALIRLSGALDPKIREVFNPAYADHVASARERLATPDEPDERDER